MEMYREKRGYVAQKSMISMGQRDQNEFPANTQRRRREGGGREICKDTQGQLAKIVSRY